MSDETYNGWSNYETWAVSLWLQNDEAGYLQVQEMIGEARGMASAYQGNPRDILADSLKELVAEASPLDEASLYTDLLGKAIGRVDYSEIATNLMSEGDDF